MRSLVSTVVLASVLVGCRSEAPALAEPSAAATVDAVATASVATPVATAMPSAPAAQRFQALGTEPFWSVDVSDAQLRYSNPENQAGTAFAAKRSGEDAELRRNPGAIPFECPLAHARFLPLYVLRAPSRLRPVRALRQTG